MRHLLLVSTAVFLTGCEIQGPLQRLDARVVDAGPQVSVDGGGRTSTNGLGAPGGAEISNALCSNGIDDDENGFADCDDFWCRDAVEVTVCGALENTAMLCGDGAANLEFPRGSDRQVQDELIDCADPDCSKAGPDLGCTPLTYELGDACANDLDDDSDGQTDCEDLDCLHASASSCPLLLRKRVLFDDAHRERAGSADWVIDSAGSYPWPTVPTQQEDWAGHLSAFGFDLVASGHFVLETAVARNGRLTFNDATNPQDLSLFAVLAVVEPSAPFSEAEAQAVLAFVRSGGGLLMVTDHFDSDRDGNGWDSVQAWNDFLMKAAGTTLDENPFGFSVHEISYEESGIIDSRSGQATTVIDPAATGHPLLAGPAGAVARVGIHKGGLFDLHTDANASARAIVHALPLASKGYATSPYVIVSEVGKGRVVGIGDSAIAGDPTDSHGERGRFDSWHEEDNAALFVNAVEWLAGNK